MASPPHQGRTTTRTTPMDETNNEAGLGHNHLLEIAQRAREGILEYQAGIIKEQAGRDDAIAGIIKFGDALIEGRVAHGTNNNAFGDWIKARKLDTVPPFDCGRSDQPRCRSPKLRPMSPKKPLTARMLSTPLLTVRTHARRHHDVVACRHPYKLTMAHAKTVAERAARLCTPIMTASPTPTTSRCWRR